jgi:hypothetical protein
MTKTVNLSFSIITRSCRGKSTGFCSTRCAGIRRTKPNNTKNPDPYRCDYFHEDLLGKGKSILRSMACFNLERLMP